MKEQYFFVIVWIIIGFFIGYLVWKIVKYYHIRQIRKDSNRRSRSVILWEVAEKIAPILPDFPYNPKDLAFVWKGVDYIVFDWLSSWKLKKIIFLEIKSWKSTLNKNEKLIRDYVSKNKVLYNIYKRV